MTIGWVIAALLHGLLFAVCCNYFSARKDDAEKMIIDYEDDGVIRWERNGEKKHAELIELIEAYEDKRKHGRWIRKESKRFYWFECSECGYLPPLDKFKREWFSGYCPNCGAKMDEVEE